MKKNKYPEFEEVYFSDEEKKKPKKSYKEALKPGSTKQATINKPESNFKSNNLIVNSERK